MDRKITSARNKIINLFGKHVSRGKVDTYKRFGLTLVPGKRSGCFIYDENGNRFINCHCNGGVFNLGHRNSRITKAVTGAMKKYDIGNHHLISGPKGELGRLISKTMPVKLNQVVYGVSGGEAVDFAIKLARGVTGRGEIISAKGGYHGHTGLAMAAGDRKFRDIFKPVPSGFRQVKFNSVKDLEKAVSEKTAAVIFETIPATLGIVVPDADFFRKAKKICEKYGALLVIDEVQTGFGRTGKMWGFENFGFEPDIVVLGKGMSGGIYPVSATVFREELGKFLEKDPFIHISTFGGSEIGCIAAMEVIRISSEKGFLEKVNDTGRFFREEFGRLSEQYKVLGLEPRGIGLMMGLRFRNELTALGVMKNLFDNGIYTVYSGNDPSVLQFLPPLIIDMKTAALVLKKTELVFRKMT